MTLVFRFFGCCREGRFGVGLTLYRLDTDVETVSSGPEFRYSFFFSKRSTASLMSSGTRLGRWRSKSNTTTVE